MKRMIVNFLITVMLGSTSILVFSQNQPINPFGLVYQDAIKENIPGKVNIHPVTYKLNGIFFFVASRQKHLKLWW